MPSSFESSGDVLAAGPAGGPRHVARAVVLAVAAMGLALAAHRVAGGAVPGPAWLGALTALTLAAALVLTGRRLGACSLVAGLGSMQVALHYGLWLLSAGGAASVVVHDHHHASVLVTASTCVRVEPVMVLAHGVATVLAALLLARGEAFLWLVASVVTPVVRLRRVVLPGTARLPLPAVTIAPSGCDLVTTRPLRGPPRLA